VTAQSLTLLASLAAPVAGTDGRERWIKLVPWDEPGRANIGPWGRVGVPGLMVRRAFADSLTADAKIVGVYGHNRPAEYGPDGQLLAAAVSAPVVSRIVPGSLENRPDGLWGRVRIGRTPLADQLLAEIEDGIRDGASVEATDLQFHAEDGHLIGGRLDFFAHVNVGAYDSARVFQAVSPTPTGDPVTLPAPAPALAASAVPAGPVLQANLQPATSTGQPVPAVPAAQPAAQPVPAAQPAPAAPALDLAGLQGLLAQLQQQAPAPAPAPAPALSPELQTLLAGLQQLSAGAHVGGQPAQPSAAALMGTAGVPTPPAGQPGATLTAEDPLREAGRLAAALYQSGGSDQGLYAALKDITASGLPLFQEGGGRLGEKLWEGTKDTTRPFVDLMAPGELTAMKYPSWQWTALPEMEEWAGDKNLINGNAVELEQVWNTAKRCAAGWDVDRKYRDFGDQLFWTEFFTEQTNAYRRLSNRWAAEAIVAAALDVSDAANYADAVDAAGPLPVEAKTLVAATGVPEASTQLLKAAAIARVIMQNTPRVEQAPDYFLVNAFDWLRLIDLAAIDLPAFLALLGVTPDRFQPHIKVPAGQLVAGVKPAMKFRELPGTGGKGSPIRVEALDVARGGVDSAVFGYVGISLERPGGVLSVPLAEPAGA